MTENFYNFYKNINNNDNNRNIQSTDTYDEFFFGILKEYTNNSDYNLNDSNFNLIENFTYDDILCDHYKMMAITDSTQLSDSLYNEELNENSEHLSLAYENLKVIPKNLIENNSKKIKSLDLSHNQLKNLTFLTNFKLLHTLILDKNIDLDEKTLPRLNNLEILWLNNCNILNIPKWIYHVQLQCPNLRHLSILGNPGARTKLVLGDSTSDVEENDFRNLIFELLPNLNYLDGVPTKNYKKILDERKSNRFNQREKNGKLLLQNNGNLDQNQNQNNNKKAENKNLINGAVNGVGAVRSNFLATSIRDLFRFNSRRRKNLNNQSSSTN